MQSWTKLMYVNSNRSSSVKIIKLRNYCNSNKSVPPVVTRLLDRCTKPFIQKQPLELAKKLANDVLSHNNSAALTGIERPKIEEIFKSNQNSYDSNTQFERCNLELVESIPTGLEFPGKECHTSTYDAWLSLLKSAEKSIDIVAFYWSLTDKTGYETSWQGKEILDAIEAAAQRGVKIRIAQHVPGKIFQQEESADLAARGLAEVRNLNFAAYGAGVLHTKMWVVDNKHIFLGSANMDWRSLTEVKELGVVVRNNSSVALDMGKIFSVYWEMGDRRTPPHKWSREMETNYNEDNPLRLQCVLDDGKNGAKGENVESEDPISTYCKANIFLSSCPREFNPRGREHDLEAVMFAIENAAKYIRISVMEYLPATFFMRRNNRYWPNIDNALRAAAFRGVKVDLLVSKWKHTKKEMVPYLKSLLQINPALRSGQISVKVFTVPSDDKQSQIDHARVNHAKYLVTDKVAYIGTSNWAGDYFITTAGVSMVIESVDSREIVEKFNQVFLRDWNSEYAKSLDL
uniref:PLD phosphodiesterase domain-containing protein n=1 Tax=Ditylenchus dipsaci TaxID=166011 RepID=A0A915E246_9BILA